MVSPPLEGAKKVNQTELFNILYVSLGGGHQLFLAIQTEAVGWGSFFSTVAHWLEYPILRPKCNFAASRMFIIGLNNDMKQKAVSGITHAVCSDNLHPCIKRF